MSSRRCRHGSGWVAPPLRAEIATPPTDPNETNETAPTAAAIQARNRDVRRINLDLRTSNRTQTQDVRCERRSRLDRTSRRPHRTRHRTPVTTPKQRTQNSIRHGRTSSSMRLRLAQVAFDGRSARPTHEANFLSGRWASVGRGGGLDGQRVRGLGWAVPVVWVTSFADGAVIRP